MGHRMSEKKKDTSPKTHRCLWLSDSTPKPQKKIVQICSKINASKWLKNQTSSEHWHPCIEKIVLDEED